MAKAARDRRRPRPAGGRNGRSQAKVDPVRLVALVRQRPDLTLVPPAALKLNLDMAEGSGQMAQKRAPTSHQPAAMSHDTRRSRTHAPAPSWWTKRALEGDVRPGFSKEEMTRPARENPRGPGGLFDHVGALLSELLDQG